MLFFSQAPTLKKDISPSGSKGFALVELFSSEGCSSCPPAERFMNELLKKDDLLNVYVIEFHVDYWDDLGWKDTLANSAYTQRQQHYGDFFKLSSIYTPQVVINGKSEMVGSEKDKINSVIGAELDRSPSASIQCSITREPNSKLEIGYTITGTVDNTGILNFAVIESGLTTSIKKGENAHLTITHNNAVRVFESIKLHSYSGKITIDTPHINISKSKLICFIQNSQNMNIIAASQYSLDSN